MTRQHNLLAPGNGMQGDVTCDLISADLSRMFNGVCQKNYTIHVDRKLILKEAK